MKIREENCNMVLLAVVTVFTGAIAGGATLLKPAEGTPIRYADRTGVRPALAASPDRKPTYVADLPPVRVVGAPFFPNTDPRRHQ